MLIRFIQIDIHTYMLHTYIYIIYKRKGKSLSTKFAKNNMLFWRELKNVKKPEEKMDLVIKKTQGRCYM